MFKFGLCFGRSISNQKGTNVLTNKILLLLLSITFFACGNNSEELKNNFATTPAKEIIWKACQIAGGYNNWISKKNLKVEYILGRHHSLSKNWRYEKNIWHFEVGERFKIHGEFDEKEDNIEQANLNGKYKLAKNYTQIEAPEKTELMSDGEFANKQEEYLRQIEVTRFLTISNKNFLSAPFNLIDLSKFMDFELLPEKVIEGIKTIPIKVTFKEDYPYNKDWFVYFFNAETFRIERVFFEYANFGNFRGIANFENPTKFGDLELMAKRTYYRSNLNLRKASTDPSNSAEIKSIEFLDKIPEELFQGVK